MKIIDLLVKIANNEEVPKKIRIFNCEWKYSKTINDYFCEEIDSCLVAFIGTNDLNSKVEILEDKPKKIEKILIF